ncbi:hypothetical protein DFH09DRAFT_1313124 [Mycena vulgaris]|nr:hypothetical protein DFH09DRAFT_1313124 [Mycena vulgaris]
MPLTSTDAAMADAILNGLLSCTLALIFPHSTLLRPRSTCPLNVVPLSQRTPQLSTHSCSQLRPCSTRPAFILTHTARADTPANPRVVVLSSAALTEANRGRHDPGTRATGGEVDAALRASEVQCRPMQRARGVAAQERAGGVERTDHQSALNEMQRHRRRDSATPKHLRLTEVCLDSNPLEDGRIFFLISNRCNV